MIKFNDQADNDLEEEYQYLLKKHATQDEQQLIKDTLEKQTLLHGNSNRAKQTVVNIAYMANKYQQGGSVYAWCHCFRDLVQLVENAC